MAQVRNFFRWDFADHQRLLSESQPTCIKLSVAIDLIYPLMIH